MRFYIRLIGLTKKNRRKSKQNKNQPQRVEGRHCVFLATPIGAMSSKRRFILGAATNDRVTLAMPVRGAVLAPVRWLEKASLGVVSDIQEMPFKERNKVVLGAICSVVLGALQAPCQAHSKRHSGAPATPFSGILEAPFQTSYSGALEVPFQAPFSGDLDCVHAPFSGDLDGV